MSFFVSSRRLMAACAIASAVATTSLSAQTIVQPSNGEPLFGFGNPAELYVPTVGQSFVAVGSLLNSFSFWLVNEADAGTPGNTANASDLTFTAYLAEWNGANIGATIFSSALQSGPQQLSQRYTFNTGGLSITDGALYMAFLTVPDIDGNISAGVEQSDNSSAGGDGWFSLANDLVSLANSTDDRGEPRWFDLAGGQLHFEVEFGRATVVPEPASMSLLAGAVVGSLLVARRRRTHAESVARADTE